MIRKTSGKKKLSKAQLQQLTVLGIFVLIIGFTAFNIYQARGIKEKLAEQKAAAAETAASIGGDFTLTDTKGNTVSNSDFNGKLRLVFFGFTNCPNICPVSLLTITNALKQLGDDASEVTPILITVDPERDTPQVMAEYLSNFHPSFVGLTGTLEQTRQVASVYKTYYAKQPANEGGEYEMDHSGFIYLMDREGKYLAHFPHDTSEAAIVEAIKPQL